MLYATHIKDISKPIHLVLLARFLGSNYASLTRSSLGSTNMLTYPIYREVSNGSHSALVVTSDTSQLASYLEDTRAYHRVCRYPSQKQSENTRQVRIQDAVNKMERETDCCNYD